MSGERELSSIRLMKTDREFVFGIHSVHEAVESGSEIDRILVRKDYSNSQIKDILKNAYRLNIPIQKVPKEKLNAVTGKNHQGIIAFLSAIKYASLDHIITDAYSQGTDPLLLILDHITDVHNLGAIARTAEGLGFNGIILPSKGSARLNSEAVKISAGALMHLPVCRVKSLLSTIDYLKNNGIRMIACTEKANDSIYSCDMNGPACLVLGSEFDGISREILNKSDLRVHIPMHGRVSSFNVSVSMAIVGSELIRQRLS
jgi:23S rRNA (guanosine2251-2'-O)-methyltransferase